MRYLGDMKESATIACPWCQKVVFYSYEANGSGSFACKNCKKLMYCDFERLTSEKATIKQKAN